MPLDIVTNISDNYRLDLCNFVCYSTSSCPTSPRDHQRLGPGTHPALSSSTSSWSICLLQRCVEDRVLASEVTSSCIGVILTLVASIRQPAASWQPMRITVVGSFRSGCWAGVLTMTSPPLIVSITKMCFRTVDAMTTLTFEKTCLRVVQVLVTPVAEQSCIA